MRARTINIALLEHGEVGLIATSGSHILQTVKYLHILTVLLEAELVTREAQYNEAMRVSRLQLVELGVIPRGRASERSDVLDQHHSASVDIEVHFVAVQGDGCEVVERLDCLSHSARQTGACVALAAIAPTAKRQQQRILQTLR